jgi:hypothetical protein
MFILPTKNKINNKRGKQNSAARYILISFSFFFFLYILYEAYLQTAKLSCNRPEAQKLHRCRIVVIIIDRESEHGVARFVYRVQPCSIQYEKLSAGE